MTKKAKVNAANLDILPRLETLKYLFNLGYFGGKKWAEVKKIQGPALEKTVKAYQKFNGLKPSGHVNAETAHRISRRRCGLPDFNLTAPSGSPCRWPMKTIAYFHEIQMPGITEEQVRVAYDLAFAQWAEVCDIEPTRVERKEVANIYARSGRGKKHNLDARGGTLTWSELPCDV